MIKISACAIMKNEETNLPGWLACMQALAQEIIVVDTGSTDNTVSLALQAGAEVYHYDWCGDFAAAKNYAIEKASGDWIIMLDADETIPASQWTAVRQNIERYHANPQILGFMCNQINIDADMHNKYISSGYQIRIFRNLPRLRYVRPIHEVLQYRGKKKKSMQVVEDFSIYHTGYSARRVRQKLERNLELLLEKIKRGEKQAADDYYLQDCYYGLGNYEKACEYAQKAARNKLRTIGGENRSYAVWIQCLIFLHKPLLEIEKVVDEAMEKFPAAAEFQLQLGFADWQYGDYIQAEKNFLQGIAKQQQFAQSESRLLLQLEDAASSLLPDVYVNLARLRCWQGKKEAAVEYLRQALHYNRYHQEAGKQLVRLLAQVTDAELIEIFNQMYDKEADSSYLAEVMQQAGRLTGQLYYSQQGKMVLTAVQEYILTGNIKAAAEELAREMQSLLLLGCLAVNHEPQTFMALQALLPQDFRGLLEGTGKRDLRKAWELMKKE